MFAANFVVIGAVAAQSTVQTAVIKEDLRIDAQREDFSAVGHVRVNARGEMAIGFGQDGQVRFYDAKGKRYATVGRKGSGPGEFQSVAVGDWNADTVWAYDWNLRRMTFISRDGRIVRTTPFVAASSGKLTGRLSSASIEITKGSSYAPQARSIDGAIWGITAVTRKRGNAAPILENAMVVQLANGETRAIATMPGWGARWELEFSPNLVMAYATDASHAAYVRVDDMLRKGGTYTLLKFAANGDTLLTRTFPYDGVPLSSARRDSILARGVGIDRVHKVAPERIPPVLSPVEQLALGSDGQSWLIVRDSENSYRAMLLNSQGVPRAQFRMPPNARVQAANATHLWMKVADDDGLESVVRYRVTCAQKVCR